jgi:hypothetical protein
MIRNSKCVGVAEWWAKRSFNMWPLYHSIRLQLRLDGKSEDAIEKESSRCAKSSCAEEPGLPRLLHWVHGFHRAVYELSAYSYVATREAEQAAVDVDNLRRIVADQASRDLVSGPVFLPQHVKVTPIYDSDHVLRAHVCVACRVDDGSGAADFANGTEITPRMLMQPRYENYDVMRDSNKVLQRVPPVAPLWRALHWKPMMVTIVFTGTERGLDLWFETNLRFWRTALGERTLHDGTPIFPKDLVDANGTAHRGFLNMFCKGRQSDDGNSMWDQIRGALTWDGETEPDLLMRQKVSIWLLFGTAQPPRPSPESLPATAEWKVVYLWDKEFLD